MSTKLGVMGISETDDSPFVNDFIRIGLAWKSITEVYVCYGEAWMSATERNICITENWET